jgi:acetolactate synthase-1/2/3 large subunit
MTGGELVARALAAASVRQVFTLVGGHTTPVADACVDAGIRLVDVRHEEAAAHMAHAWSRTTGETGVALVTAGPGVTNTATGIANAWSGGAPVLLLGGRAPLAQADRGALHEIDQIALMQPITKWAATVYEAERLPEYVARALAEARAGRPGPVFLELPSDVLRAEADVQTTVAPAAPPRAAGDPAAIAAAAELLGGASRPLVVGGSGVFWSGASRELVSLVERLEAPVLVSHAARGIVPDDHRNHVGAARSRALRGADVVLVVGSRFNFMLAYGQPPRWNPHARVVQVDADPAALGRNRHVDVAIAGDAGLVLRQLREAVPKRAPATWLAELRAADAAARARLARLAQEETGGAMHPLALCASLAEALEPDAFLAVDGGDILSFARQAVPSRRPGGWLDSGSFGCLGHGIASACAAKIAFPDRQAVALVGDGAFGLGAVELDTAARHGLPILVVVSNNSAWGIEATSQQMEFGRAVATSLEERPYHLLAESLGCEGRRVGTRRELDDALAVPLGDRPRLLDVVTDSAARSPDVERGLGLVPTRQAVAFE